MTEPVIASPTGARQTSLNNNPGVADNATSPLTEGVGKGERESPTNQVYNVAVGDRAMLNQLYDQLHLNLLPSYPHLQGAKPVYRDFRADDVRHSLADISKASKLLGYQPTHRIGEGLKVAMEWYIQHLSAKS